LEPGVPKVYVIDRPGQVCRETLPSSSPRLLTKFVQTTYLNPYPTTLTLTLHPNPNPPPLPSTLILTQTPARHARGRACGTSYTVPGCAAPAGARPADWLVRMSRDVDAWLHAPCLSNRLSRSAHFSLRSPARAWSAPRAPRLAVRHARATVAQDPPGQSRSKCEPGQCPPRSTLSIGLARFAAKRFPRVRRAHTEAQGRRRRGSRRSEAAGRRGRAGARRADGGHGASRSKN